MISIRKRIFLKLVGKVVAFEIKIGKTIWKKKGVQNNEMHPLNETHLDVVRGII